MTFEEWWRSDKNLSWNAVDKDVAKLIWGTAQVAMLDVPLEEVPDVVADS